MQKTHKIGRKSISVSLKNVVPLQRFLDLYTMTKTQYGYFDDIHREYVITNPRTPFPWINYLGNEDFFGLISNTAGGYTFYKDAKFRRITRYR